MNSVGIVGAGAAGSAIAFALATEAPDTSVTVIEKSGGVCGRAATRRRGAVTYDYGANYLKDADERVVELVTETGDAAGLEDIEEPVYTFDETGTVSPGDDRDDHKWSYQQGLTQIAKRLFARTDAAVHRRTRAETLVREGTEWSVIDTDGERWGPFDALVLTPPAPQTADLVSDAEWDSPSRETLAAAVGAVEYQPIWTAVLGYPFTLDVPYYALVNTDKNHEVGWLSREECKPGHVPDGESVLIVQASPEWSADRYDDPPAENVAQLASHAVELVGDDRLREPAWTDHQGWRYALPDGAADSAALEAGTDAGLYLAGDWVAGDGRIHAALANGLDVGKRVARSLDGERRSTTE
ncbi:FAD-dependent oxidoreductase [Halobacteria archaeon AArc-dxtr1]|nr:FAD-dependent oxidoreductase [Halobacteria archaeon AArc-dxtr1]